MKILIILSLLLISCSSTEPDNPTICTIAKENNWNYHCFEDYRVIDCSAELAQNSDFELDYYGTGYTGCDDYCHSKDYSDIDYQYNFYYCDSLNRCLWDYTDLTPNEEGNGVAYVLCPD